MTKEEKEKWNEKQKQQIYGILIFLAWLGIVLLLQTFVPVAALFLRESWYMFGIAGMLLMAYLTWKSRSISVSDAMSIIFMIFLGPVGVMFLLTWLGLVKIQRKRINRHGKTVQSA